MQDILAPRGRKFALSSAASSRLGSLSLQFSLVEKKQRFKPGWLFPQSCWIVIPLVWSNAERLKLASVHTKAVSSSEILVIVKQTNKDKHPFIRQWHSDKRFSCWSYFTATNDRSSARRMFPQLNPFIVDFSQIDLPFLRQETYSLSISVSIKLPFPVFSRLPKKSVLSVHWQEKSVACSNISPLNMKRTIAVEKESSAVKYYWKRESERKRRPPDLSRWKISGWNERPQRSIVEILLFTRQTAFFQ